MGGSGWIVRVYTHTQTQGGKKEGTNGIYLQRDGSMEREGPIDPCNETIKTNLALFAFFPPFGQRRERKGKRRNEIELKRNTARWRNR